MKPVAARSTRTRASRSSVSPRETRPRPSFREPLGRRIWFKLAFMVVGLMIVLALIADLRSMGRRRPLGYVDVTEELQQLVLGLDGPRYADPQQLFSIVRPAGWRMFTPPDSRPYNVIFRGPNQAAVSILVSRVPYNDLPSLMRAIEERERAAGIRTQVEALFFQGMPAVRRTAGLVTARVMSLDFVRDHVAHHILCEAPPELFDRYRPFFEDLLNTYRPYVQATNIAPEE